MREGVCRVEVQREFFGKESKRMQGTSLHRVVACPVTIWPILDHCSLACCICFRSLICAAVSTLRLLVSASPHLIPHSYLYSAAPSSPN